MTHAADRPRVLVVDDSRTMRKIVIRLLAEAGYHHTREAADGHEAMEVLEDGCDLVVSDWLMGTHDGMSLLKYMRRDAAFREIPFVMATRNGREAFEREAAHFGAVYLAKPFGALALSDSVTRAYATVREWAMVDDAWISLVAAPVSEPLFL